MKTTFKFIIAAMAAIAVFSSCQKELVNESANKTTDGVRTISVQFDNSTKATLDNFTPKFVNGDEIRVSNASESKKCTVSVDASGNATFTTTLTGALTAIYPAEAAVFTPGTPDGAIQSPYFKVPSSQTGKVEDAIIAKAEIAAESSIATFNGVTALIEITPPSTAKKITVTSLKKVESGSRTGTVADINTEDTGKTVITVGDGSADLPSTIYVALVPGVNLTDLSFDAGENIGLKGIPTNKLGSYSDQTAAKTKYTIGNTNWHPYVEIQMNSKTYKWATRNIGATADTGPDSYGTYFAWGDKQGQEATNKAERGSSGVFAFTGPGFKWSTAPFNGGNSSYNREYFESVFRDECPGRRLALKNDAANVNWGGSWRMPTAIEIDELKSLKRGSFDSGYYFGDSEANKIFLPAAGFGWDAFLYYAGEYGHYWSSELYINDYSNAYCLRFEGTGHDNRPVVLQDGRDGGHSVRAVSD